MTTQSEIAELARQLELLQQETRANSRFLASSIRRSRLGLTVPEHDEAVRRLRQPTSLLDWHPRPGQQNEPKVQGGLIDRLRQGQPVSDSLGNVDATAGSTNEVRNPAFEDFDAIGTTIATSLTTVAHEWRARYVVNSGAVSQPPKINQAEARGTSTFGANSAVIGVNLPYGNPASDTETTLESVTAFYANALPYLVAGLTLVQMTNLASTATLLTARIEIVADSSGAVVGQSIDWDLLDGIPATGIRMVGAFRNMAPGTDAYRWRLRIREVRSAVVGGSPTRITFAQPQAVQSFTPDPVPYAPLLGQWIPSYIEGYGDPTDLEPELRVGSPSTMIGPTPPAIQFGAGAGLGYDVRIRRTGLRELTVDDPTAALNDPAVKVSGPVFARGPATMDLAIGYAAPGQPSSVSRSDNGGAISTTTITYAGAQVASVVTTRFGRTITVVPTYSGSDITAIHRTVA